LAMHVARGVHISGSWVQKVGKERSLTQREGDEKEKKNRLSFWEQKRGKKTKNLKIGKTNVQKTKRTMGRGRRKTQNKKTRGTGSYSKKEK